MREPRVAVVLPVRNGGRYFGEAIDSILNQTYAGFNLVIVDDGSTDGTRALAESRAAQDGRIRLVMQEPAGISAALNRGIAATTAPLIARMDADDVSLPSRLAEQVAFIDRHPSVAVVGTFAQIIDSDGAERGTMRLPTQASEIKALLRFKNQVCHPSVMMKREAIETAGGYDERMLFAEDHELWLRLAQRHDIVNMPEVLLKYRDHPLQGTDRRNRGITTLFSALCVLNAVLAENGLETIVPAAPDQFDFAKAVQRIGRGLATVRDPQEREALYYQIARLLRVYRHRAGMELLLPLTRPHALRDRNFRFFVRELFYRLA